MATTHTEECDTSTITTTEQPIRPHSPTLVLELHRPTETGPRVRWTEGTIDNEYLNKKKSKCCCIYTKPHDPHANDDDNNPNKPTVNDEYENCQHCRYHTESDYAAKPEERQVKVKILVNQSKSS